MIPTLRYLLGQLAQHKSFTLQSLVLLLLMALVNLPLPLLQKLAVDHAIPAGQAQPLILLGLLAFVVRALASGFQVVQNLVVWRIMTGIGARLRARMVHAMLAAPVARIGSGEVPAMVGRLTSDVESIEQLIYDAMRFIIRPLGMIAVMVAVMVLISPLATALVMVATPLAMLVGEKLSRDLEHLQRTVLERRQELQRSVAETLGNIRVVRCLGRSQLFAERIRRDTTRYTEAATGHATREQAMNALIEVVNLLPWLLLVGFGCLLVRDGSITLGDFLAFIAFEQLLRSPLIQLAWYLLHLKAELAAPERVEATCALPDEGGGAAQPAAPWTIELRGIDFAYRPGTPVLQQLDLQVQPGERVALVGPSGGGKSTVLGLLCGFYRPQGGSLRLGGVDLAEAELRELRRKLGVVFQDNPMFDASVRDNLRLGEEHEDEAIWNALGLADAAGFVRALPAGLDTLIGVRGLKLSGGQRQRLAIARVALRRPPVVLLDEATSSLDALSEQQIQRALERLLAGCTSLTVAHRLSTVLGANRICYLEGGRVLESGSHRELLALGGRYAALYRTQMAGGA